MFASTIGNLWNTIIDSSTYSSYFLLLIVITNYQSLRGVIQQQSKGCNVLHFSSNDQAYFYVKSLSISLASPLPRSHSTISVAAVEAAVVVEPFLSSLLQSVKENSEPNAR